VIGRGNQEQFVIAQLHRFDLAMLQPSSQADLHLVSQHHIQDLFRTATSTHRYTHAGVTVAETFEQGCRRCRLMKDTEPRSRVPVWPSRGFDLGFGFGHFLQYSLRMWQERLSRIR